MQQDSRTMGGKRARMETVLGAEIAANSTVRGVSLPENLP